MKKISVLTVLVFLLTVNGIDAAEKMIRLPLPQKSGGKSIMECLTLRRSVKSFLPGKKLSAQHLSNVLYAADGINRPDNRRTIPTARNLQNQTVYAVLREGIYQYDPYKHQLKLVKDGNFIAECGNQSYHKNAAVILIYVSDLKVIGSTSEGNAACAGTHAGAAAQNVYLYAASEGLGTVICGNIDEKKLAKMLKLETGKKVFYIQPIGYPAE